MLNPLSFWQHWPSLNATQVGQPYVKFGGRGEEDGEGDDIDDEFENVFGETEPETITGSVADLRGCTVSSLPLARGIVLALDGEYLETIAFSSFALDIVSRKICSKSVCCIKANCSAPFKTLDVMKTSISGCNKI